MDPFDENLGEGSEEEKSQEHNKLNSFFIVWESNCRNFIDQQLQFSCNEAMESVKVHVFMRKDTPSDALPPLKNWVEHHITCTTCPYASDTAICAWLVQQIDTMSSQNDRELVMYLVSDRDRKYEELIDILQTNNLLRTIHEINGCEKTILDVLEHVCHWCKMVFLNQSEKESHFNSRHNYFCSNLQCNTKRFASEKELRKHIQNQKRCNLCEEDAVFCSEGKLLLHLQQTHQHSYTRNNEISNDTVCQFCPKKNFSSIEQKEIHMKYNHKKCNCSCGQYFRSRDEYLEHFYAVYPLACYENRKCPQRFQSVVYQAIHHKQDHFAIQPFYCVPCHQNDSTAKVCFKDENSLRIHGASLGHDRCEMYLPELNTTKLSQRRVPSRTCSAINYC